MLPDPELLAAEDQGWRELDELIGSLTPAEAEMPGYYSEGWSAKDMLGHIASWLAEAGVILEQIAVGTFRPEEIDIDEMNRRFLDAVRDLPMNTIKAMAAASRTRMLQAWQALPERSLDAEYWIRKAGPEHYGEHLPRLRDWIAELHARRGRT